jgi:RecA-family ATPase
VTAAATAIRTKLKACGYAPLPLNGKAPSSVKGWQTKFDVTAEEIGLWEKLYPYDTNTGVLTKFVPTLDIDITHPEAARAIEDLTRARFEDHGRILVRTGRAPKRAIPLRTNEPFDKLIRNLVAPNGNDQKIEVLANGQQVVVFGTHPETKLPYTWHGGEPGDVKLEELPAVNEQDMRALLDDAVELLITEYGFKDKGGSKTKEDNGADQDGGNAGEHDRTDWGALIARVLAGGSLHDSLRDLAASFVTSGVSDKAAIEQLRSLLTASTAPKDARWRDRYNEIPGLVRSGRDKFEQAEGQATVLRSYFAEDLEREPVEPVDWVVQDFIPSRAVSGFFGDGGTGKDKILFQLATAMTCNEQWLGKDVKQGRVIYFPVEDDDKELNRRREAIASHYHLSFANFPGRLKIVPMAGKNTVLAAFDHKTGVVKPTPLFYEIRKIIEDFKPGLVIVGNRVNIFSVNQNEDAQARQCVQLLSGLALDYETAVIMPGHVSIAGMNSGVGTSGSVQWSNACRSRIYLSRVVDGERGGNYELNPDLRFLEVKKANWGPTDKKIALRWSKGVFVPDDGTASWTFGEVAALIEAEKEFLRMLDLIGLAVSPAPSAPNNAPKVFSDDARCKLKGRRGKLALKAAMERLLTKGTIRIEESGPESKRRVRVVRTFPEGQREAAE